MKLSFAAISGGTVLGLCSPAFAQFAISANDGKVMLIDGVNSPRPDPQPDTVTIIDASASLLRESSERFVRRRPAGLRPAR